MAEKRQRPIDVMATGQGAYYLVTGIWPILHMRSFEAVTGPKVDKWLVKTVGGMIAITGALMLKKGLERTTDDDTIGVAVAGATFLTGIDVWYSLKGRISKIYLADAVTEVGLLAAWWAARRASGENGESEEGNRE
jgi:hypothetical protein